MSDISELLAPLLNRGVDPEPVEELKRQVVRRRRKRRAGLTVLALAAVAAVTVTATSLAGRSPRYVSVQGVPTFSAVSLPPDQLVQDISVANGGLLLSGQPSGSSNGECTAIAVDPATLTFGQLRSGSCQNPLLSGHQVGVVVEQGSSSGFDSTVRVATADPTTGRFSVGPVLFRYADASDTRPVIAYGGGRLWVYDVATSSGPEVVQVSASTGQLQATVVMPKLFRPVLAANDDGLWAGESIEGTGVGTNTLYQVAPGGHEPTPVIAGSAVVRWLVAAGHQIWVGTTPRGATAQEIWRFDGSANTQVFRVPENGFDPTAVIGNEADGLWTMQWQPPLNSETPSGSRKQQVIRIDPDTGVEHVVATLPAVPVPPSPGSFGLLAGQAAVLNGSLYLLEPPFRSNGYQGYSRLIRVPVAGSVQAGPPATGTAGSTAPSTARLPACRASQLLIQLKGIQGAAGNFAAGYWIANKAPDACALQSPVTVKLLDRTGQARLSATSTFVALALSPSTAIPAGDTVSSGELAYLTLFWPADGSFSGGRCPTPDFTPAAVQIVFAGAGPSTVRNTPVNGRQVTVCGQHISIQTVGPLGHA